MKKLTLLLQAFAGICIGSLILAQSALASDFSVDVDKNGVALKGHDPVAYFSSGQPTMGSSEFTAKVGGVTYQFSSAENRDLFVANPDKYKPAYGGFCAYGVTFKVKVNGDPNAWKIVDDKLYINSSLDSRKKWSTDIPGNIDKGNKIWPTIKDIDPSKL